MRTYGIQGIPQQYLVDVKGIVAHDGHAGPGQIEPLLADADVLPPGEYSRKFDAVKRAVNLGQFGNAWDMCAKLEKDKTDGENAQKLKAWIDERGKKALDAADKCLADGAVMDAIDGYQDVEKRWKGDSQKAAKAKLDGLKKDKDNKKALEAKKFWDAARDAEAKGDKATAAAAYHKVAKTCKGTRVGDEAEAKVKALQ